MIPVHTSGKRIRYVVIYINIRLTNLDGLKTINYIASNTFGRTMSPTPNARQNVHMSSIMKKSPITMVMFRTIEEEK